MSAEIPGIMGKSEATRSAYSKLIATVSELDGVEVQEKKTSLHIAAGKAAFLGVHPRKTGIRLNIVLDRRLEGERIVKSDQVSRSRFHNELDLDGIEPIDAELTAWINEAYSLQTV